MLHYLWQQPLGHAWGKVCLVLGFIYFKGLQQNYWYHYNDADN